MAGRRLHKGGSSSSSSSSQTISTDKRLAIESGIGISSDQSTVTVNALDAGVVHDALQVVAASDATSGESFNRVLGLAGSMFENQFKALENSQVLTGAAFSTAANDKAGTIDNRTIAVIAVTAAVGVVAFAAVRKK